MVDRSFIKENEASRLELSELIGRLDESLYARPIGTGWTIATSLCHIVFWDQRTLYLLKKWESAGRVEPDRPGPQTIESINVAVNAIALAVPGKAAGEAVLSSALAVDAHVAALRDSMLDELIAHGLERYMNRHLHRREHLGKIRQELER
jgi:hypothetical protein